MRRQPRSAGPGEAPNEPVRAGSAALHAITAAIDLPTCRGKARSALQPVLNAELQLIGSNDVGAVDFRDWATVTLAVDDDPAPARSRLIDGSRVVVADLPEVVLAITAAPDLDVAALPLVDVRDRLDDYPWPAR